MVNAPGCRMGQSFARWLVSLHNLQHPPFGYMPFDWFFGHFDARWPFPEQTKQDAKGRGFSGSTGSMHLERLWRRDPHLQWGHSELVPTFVD